MYFFYNPTSRKIISATEMGLTPEELENFKSPGTEVIEESIENLEDWRYELSDYYVSSEGQILKGLEYIEFAEPIKLKVGESYHWTVTDDNTQLYDLQRGNNNALSVGEIVGFASLDPGIYKFELSSVKYKTCIITVEVTL